MRNLEKHGVRLRNVCLLAALMLTGPLAGCARPDRAVATSTIPEDYHLRHPIVLADARQTLDIFTVGASDKFDERQAQDLKAFAADYRAHGEGRILIEVPKAPTRTQAAEATLAAIRKSLAANGVTGEIEVGAYNIADPRLAAPLRMSFTKLQARVASRCGEWPQDLGSGAGLDDWDNKSYYNFGCASQQTLTAQIDDPRDLVRPRSEDPSDVLLRTRAIGLIRATPGAQQGQDPGTNWKPGYSTVGVIGQQ